MKAVDQLHKCAMEEVWEGMVREAQIALQKGWKHDEWSMETLDFQTILYVNENFTKTQPRDRRVPPDAENES